MISRMTLRRWLIVAALFSAMILSIRTTFPGPPPEQHYAALGVRCGATSKDIKKAYRKLLRRFFPDRREALRDPEGTRRTYRAFALAYKVLSDPERRKAHDELYC